MHTERDDLVAALRERGHHDRALAARCRLPRQVDTEADAHLLHQLDIGETTLRLSAVPADAEPPTG